MRDEIKKYRQRRQNRLKTRRDEEIWRTTEKGKHYALETETGEVTKGNIGHKTVETIKGQREKIAELREQLEKHKKSKTKTVGVYQIMEDMFDLGWDKARIKSAIEKKKTDIDALKAYSKTYDECGRPQRGTAEYEEYSKKCDKLHMGGDPALKNYPNDEFWTNKLDEDMDGLKDMYECRKEWDKGNKDFIRQRMEEAQKEEEAKEAETTRLRGEIDSHRRKVLERQSKKLKTADDCKDTEDVEDYVEIHGYMDGNIDFSEMTVKSSVGMARAMDKVFTAYPKMKGKLKGIRVVDSGWIGSESAVAGTTPESREILFNREKYVNDEVMDEISAEASRSKFWGKGAEDDSRKYVMTHELGHLITMECGGHQYISERILSKTVEHFGKHDVVEKARMMVDVSAYAGSNPSEFVAECFAEYMCSKNPRETSKYVVSVLEDVMREKGLL